MLYQDALIEEMNGLKKFALRLTGNVSDADDLLQSTLLRALEKRHLFQDGTSIFKWTSKIMYNLFVSNYRRKMKFETQYDPESYIEKESVAADQEVKEELDRVRRAMEELSFDHKDILYMICVQGMPYRQVSEALQIPIGTVRSRLYRARESLREQLDGEVMGYYKPLQSDAAAGHGRRMAA